MPSIYFLFSITTYFLLLIFIAWLTSRKANNESYFIGNKKSLWYVVAFGMISDSLSGVTFISVPGWVGTTHFSYLQMVFGYVVGYIVIAKILLPLYYNLNLTSIYSYLKERFGENTQKTGSFFFLLSRTIGAAFRLYLTANVIQIFIFNQWGIPFWLTVTLTIALILFYTYKGGIKTLVWTDAFQSSFLLLGVILSITAISKELNWGIGNMITSVKESEYSQIFYWDWHDKKFFFKQFFSGMFICIVMTGLDQNMMQKNLSCKTLLDAQKNFYWLSVMIVVVNTLFLSLGALLYIFSNAKGISIPAKTDDLFPMLAFTHLGMFAAIVFIIGLTAATFSSADSVLTTLTTSFCVDFLKMNERTDEEKKTSTRHRVHIFFAIILLLVILIFKAVNDDAVINGIFTVAGYTYGPLLGLFSFGLFTKIKINDKFAPVVCAISPIVSYLLDRNSQELLSGYKFGYELLILNGAITFIGLLFISKKTNYGSTKK